MAITKGANLTNDQASQIIEFLKIKDIKSLKSNIKNNHFSRRVLTEIEDLFNILSKGNFSNNVKTNFNIVRGLAYYSGFCVETNLNFKGKIQGKEIDIGSCASGGGTILLLKDLKELILKEQVCQ